MRRPLPGKDASLLLEKAKDLCAKHGFDAKIMTGVGHPGPAICRAAERLNIHLLILGSHNREGTISGNRVSTYCVKNAKCSVLVVKK